MITVITKTANTALIKLVHSGPIGPRGRQGDRGPVGPGSEAFAQTVKILERVEANVGAAQNAIAQSADQIRLDREFIDRSHQAIGDMQSDITQKHDAINLTKEAIDTTARQVSTDAGNVETAKRQTQEAAEIAQGINAPRAMEVTILAADVQKLSARLDLDRIDDRKRDAEIAELKRIINKGV